MSDMDTQKGCVMGSRNEYYKQYYIKNQDKKKSMALKRYYKKLRPAHLKNKKNDDEMTDLIDDIVNNPDSSNKLINTMTREVKREIKSYNEKKKICDKIFQLRSIGSSDIITSKIEKLKKEYYAKFKERLDL